MTLSRSYPDPDVDVRWRSANAWPGADSHSMGNWAQLKVGLMLDGLTKYRTIRLLRLAANNIDPSVPRLEKWPLIYNYRR